MTWGWFGWCLLALAIFLLFSEQIERIAHWWNVRQQRLLEETKRERDRR